MTNNNIKKVKCKTHHLNKYIYGNHKVDQLFCEKVCFSNIRKRDRTIKN